MAKPTLPVIINKVRLLTRSMSSSILTDDAIKEYINTFIQYDFPAHLKLFNSHKDFSFYTKPYKSKYISSDITTSDMYDFKNKVISIDTPVYIAGVPALFTTSKQQFYDFYPKTHSIEATGKVGDGATTAFSGTISNNSGIVINSGDVLFSSIDADNNGLSMIDYPISPIIGNLYMPGKTVSDAARSPAAINPLIVKNDANYINYITGDYTITFDNAPAVGKTIDIHSIKKQPSKPLAMLFYGGEITIAPTPDKPYKIEFNAFVKPSELLAASDTPYLNEWWQYIAYGAAKKVFEDRMDMESVQQILPEFKTQEKLITRRTIQQQSEQHVSTIYDVQNYDGDVDRFNNFNS